MASPVAALSPRRALTAGIAAVALGLAAFGAADANAAFTVPECGGASGVIGEGASFQGDLHRSFATAFNGSLLGCGGSVGAPSFLARGSGVGLGAAGAGSRDTNLNCVVLGVCPGGLPVGQRDKTVSFQATDDPPTRQQYADMQEGDPTTTADNAELHVIPVATGAAVMIMRLPAGCEIRSNDPSAPLTGALSGDSYDAGTQRPLITGRTVEQAFHGTISRWGELTPTISGTPTSGQYAGRYTDCADVPIRRIVRKDNSGTTYSWKAYLNLVNPSFGWTQGDYATNPNTRWPVSGVATNPTDITPAPSDGSRRPDSDPVCIGTLCSNSATGGGGLADAVNLVEGSIGYVDLAAARNKGFYNDSTFDDQDPTFWIPLEVNPEATAATGSFAEPTRNPTLHNGSNPATRDRGASCSDVDVKGVPAPATWRKGDPTLGDWSGAYAAGGITGYPACVLTYGLLWDDSSVVYGNRDDEQRKARTVKDYFRRIVSADGQAFLLGADYSQLPNKPGKELLSWAQNGVAAIDWNKSTGGTVDPPVVVPPVVVPPVVVPPAVVPPAPSNAFSIPSSKTTSSLMTFVAQLPGAGSLKVAATTKVGKKTIRVASVSASPKGAGRVTLRLKLSSAAKSALARAKSKKLSVKVAFTFTPTGGTAKTVTKTVTVRAARKAARRSSRSKKKAAKR